MIAANPKTAIRKHIKNKATFKDRRHRSQYRLEPSSKISKWKWASKNKMGNTTKRNSAAGGRSCSLSNSFLHLAHNMCNYPPRVTAIGPGDQIQPAVALQSPNWGVNSALLQPPGNATARNDVVEPVGFCVYRRGIGPRSWTTSEPGDFVRHTIGAPIRGMRHRSAMAWPLSSPSPECRLARVMSRCTQRTA